MMDYPITIEGQDAKRLYFPGSLQEASNYNPAKQFLQHCHTNLGGNYEDEKAKYVALFGIDEETADYWVWIARYYAWLDPERYHRWMAVRRLTS